MRDKTGPFHPLPRYQVEEDKDSNERQGSCDLDKDENLSFS